MKKLKTFSVMIMLALMSFGYAATPSEGAKKNTDMAVKPATVPTPSKPSTPAAVIAPSPAAVVAPTQTAGGPTMKDEQKKKSPKASTNIEVPKITPMSAEERKEKLEKARKALQKVEMNSLSK